MATKPAGRSKKSPGKTAKPAARDRGTRRAPRRAASKALAARPVRVAVIQPAATGGRPLTRREVEEFGRLLDAERNRLTEELEAIEEHLPEIEQVGMDVSGGYDEDLADVASDTFEREKVIAIENSIQQLLQQVEEALERIEDGTYGICQMCDQPIHPERLRALPYARLCIQCKAREEQAVLR